MCALYAGIYRVALRLQRAAEARRNRMAASLVTVASHTITRIGFGVSAGSTSATATTAATTGVPDGCGTNCRQMAVAELHSSSAAGDDQLKPTSSELAESVATRQTPNDEEERGMTEDDVDTAADCDENETPTVVRRLDIAVNDAKQPAELTPLLGHQQVDNGAMNNGVVGVTHSSGVDASRVTSEHRQRWLVVLPGNGEKCEESWASSDGPCGQTAGVRRSFDAGRPPRTCVRARSQRRSLFSVPTYAQVSAATTLAAQSESSFSSDEEHCESRHDIVSASYEMEMENMRNNVADVAMAGEHLDNERGGMSPEHPQNQSATFNHLSAEENQLRIDGDHVAVTSFIENCDELPSDSGVARQTVWAAKHDRHQQKINDENAEKEDDAAAPPQSVKILAARWRRRARSPFAANRRFVHLRHWKMQRRLAAQNVASSSSSVDNQRQLLVSRPIALPLSHRPTVVIDVYSD